MYEPRLTGVDVHSFDVLPKVYYGFKLFRAISPFTRIRIITCAGVGARHRHIPAYTHTVHTHTTTGASVHARNRNLVTGGEKVAIKKILYICNSMHDGNLEIM